MASTTRRRRRGPRAGRPRPLPGRGDLTVARVSRVARSLRSNLSIDSTDLDEAGAGLGAAMAPLQEGLLEYRPGALVDAMLILDDAARRASHEVSEMQGEPAAKLLARAAVDELIGALDAWGATRSVDHLHHEDESDNARLTVGPLDVSAAIGGVGIGERGAILTSATLALGGNFDVMAAATGMAVSGVPWHGIDVGSPFDHARQGIQYVATHLPLPGRDGPSEQLLDELVDLAQASGGGMLALFACAAWGERRSSGAARTNRSDGLLAGRRNPRPADPAFPRRT